MKFRLQKNYLLRRVVLPLLKALNRDFVIKHPWTRKDFRLALFEHKGYWFYGKRREFRSMFAFSCLLSPGSRVLEVGGHIGFISLYFADLVGRSGRVVVFEPATNNLDYIRSNVVDLDNIELVEAGCSDEDGYSVLYMDNLTGQNNSLVKDYQGLSANASAAKGVKLVVSSLTIRTFKIDTYCAENSFQPEFIKIDVEGHELAVLNGAANLLSCSSKPMLMVEIQADHHAIIEKLNQYGYLLFYESGEPLSEGFDSGIKNVFALHPDSHEEQIKAWRSQLEVY